jgi:hypothetical protein
MWTTCPRSASSGYHYTTSSSDISVYHADFHEGHNTVAEWQGSGRFVAGERHGMCELAFNVEGERHGMCESAFTGAQNFVVAPRCLENMCTPDVIILH